MDRASNAAVLPSFLFKIFAKNPRLKNNYAKIYQKDEEISRDGVHTTGPEPLGEKEAPDLLQKHPGNNCWCVLIVFDYHTRIHSLF